MTIIAALTDGRSAYIAADWACSYEDTDVVFYDRTPKVRQFPILNTDSTALIGMAGDVSIPTRLAGMVLPELPEDNEPSIEWAESVGQLVTETILGTPNPPMAKYEGESCGINGEFLLVIGSRIFLLVDHGAMEPSRQWAAIGTGEDFANGFLYATSSAIRPTLPASRILLDCVRATSASVSTCGLDGREPFIAIAPRIIAGRPSVKEKIDALHP
ncbi:protease [Gordonia phage DatBoi]|nr:protease [Gordonia phage DatBoi]